MATDEFLPRKEVATLLKIPKRNAYMMFQRSSLPGLEVWWQWRLAGKNIDAGVEAQNQRHVGHCFRGRKAGGGS